MARLEVLCTADDPNTLFRPCVNCGKRIGSYCDGATWHNPCIAAFYIPSEEWAQGQSTPLCNACETRFSLCRFCLGIHRATPPTWGEHPMDRRVPWTWGKVPSNTACPAETHRTHVMVPKGTAEAAGSKGDPKTMKAYGIMWEPICNKVSAMDRGSALTHAETPPRHHVCAICWNRSTARLPSFARAWD